MQDTERSDAELVRRARGGSAPAFAALLHRFGPAVHAVTVHARDPDRALVRTFVAAMRRLDDAPADAGVRDWLLALAVDEVRVAPDLDDPWVPLAEERLDAAWRELHARWPDGKRPRRLPPWIAWTSLVVALACLAVLVPYLLITLGGEDSDGTDRLPRLVARPFERDEPEEPEVVPEPTPEPPPFEFPDVDLDGDTGTGPETAAGAEEPTAGPTAGTATPEAPEVTTDAAPGPGVVDQGTVEGEGPADALTGSDPGAGSGSDGAARDAASGGSPGDGSTGSPSSGETNAGAGAEGTGDDEEEDEGEDEEDRADTDVGGVATDGSSSDGTTTDGTDVPATRTTDGGADAGADDGTDAGTDGRGSAVPDDVSPPAPAGER